MGDTTQPRESLLDTIPGRLFVNKLKSRAYPGVSPAASVRSISPRDLISLAASAADGYLYSDECREVASLEIDQHVLREFDAAGLAALSELSAFSSPHVHHGMIAPIEAPIIRNRKPLSALPHGAFWTSIPITDSDDSWTLSGENINRGYPRSDVHFSVEDVRLARIDSADDWIALVESGFVEVGSCKYPDWPALAASWDAVYLSPLGLLLAHPRISATPFTERDGSGLEHSQAGPCVSVAFWSTVSTAWLHEPPNATLRPIR